MAAPDGWPGDLLARDATAQAALVRSGEITPSDLVEAAITRLQDVNPVVNCVVASLLEAARETARAADSKVSSAPPLLGVPVLLKDLGQEVAGVRQTDGSVALRDAVAHADSWLARRYREAGMVILGKTSSPEFGNHSTTEPVVHGPCRNPWNLRRTAGGSSGGAAAAVAAGIVPAAGASDGAGSIRIPASCCGVFGLKPTRGRISAAPTAGEPLFGLSTSHAVTRSVRDSAALLDAAHGPAPGDPHETYPPRQPFAEQVKTDPPHLTVALCTESPLGTAVDPQCAAAAKQTAALLSELGHDVEEATPSFDTSVLTDAMLKIWSVANAGARHSVLARIGRPLVRGDLEETTWELVEYGERVSAVELQRAVHRMHLAARQVAPFFERYDVWLTPTIAELPSSLGVLNRSLGGAREWWERDLELNPFNPVANVTGQPAASLPLTWTDDELPVGTMLTARFGCDGLLLQLAAQLERARPWNGRWPPRAAAGLSACPAHNATGSGAK